LVTSSIDAGSLPCSTIGWLSGMIGALALPGSISTYFSPRRPRLATRAKALVWSLTSLSISSSTSALPSGRRRTSVTLPTRTPATRTLDLLSSPATESKTAVIFLVPAPRPIFTSSIFKMKNPRTPRMTSMKIPIFAADDMSFSSAE
jgi:hypothetical protein